MSTEVRARNDLDRYEISVDGELAGFTEVHVHGDVANMPHTEISPEFGGRGLATTLIRETLDDLRARGLKVHPTCPFVRAFIDKHPEYRDNAV
jgi:predicted GNAT family acetyltransferase